MKYQEHTSGWIEVICGPMFAGKTEELIRRTTRMKYSKKNYIVFKPIIDNRYSENEIVSHASRYINAINIKNTKEIEEYIDETIQAIIIDEIQFFDFDIIDLIIKYAQNGIRVICAGLDADFKGEPFKNTAYLLAIAEKVTKLNAICVVCGAEATKTQRIIDGHPANYDDPIVLVGASDSYEARCRDCHVVLKK